MDVESLKSRLEIEIRARWFFRATDRKRALHSVRRAARRAARRAGRGALRRFENTPSGAFVERGTNSRSPISRGTTRGALAPRAPARPGSSGH